MTPSKVIVATDEQDWQTDSMSMYFHWKKAFFFVLDVFNTFSTYPGRHGKLKMRVGVHRQRRLIYRDENLYRSQQIIGELSKNFVCNPRMRVYSYPHRSSRTSPFDSLSSFHKTNFIVELYSTCGTRDKWNLDVMVSTSRPNGKKEKCDKFSPDRGARILWD